MEVVEEPELIKVEEVALQLRIEDKEAIEEEEHLLLSDEAGIDKK